MKIVIMILALAFGAIAMATEAQITQQQPLLQYSFLTEKNLYNAKWDQCTEDSHCGSGHHCCLYTSGNRCVSSSTVC